MMRRMTAAFEKLMAPADSGMTEGGGKEVKADVTEIVRRIKIAAEIHAAEACEQRRTFLTGVVNYLIKEDRMDIIDVLTAESDAAYWLRDIIQDIVDETEGFAHLTPQNVGAYIIENSSGAFEETLHDRIHALYMNPELIPKPKEES